MAIKYILIFQSKALQNLPKLGFFGSQINNLATLMCLTFRVSWDEVDGPGFGPEVFAAAVDPDVHALDLVVGDAQLHVPESSWS
jgi:hypothetical protein